MADFSYLSDTDDSAVEELISRTQDLCILEQISAINCSSFTESVLPTDLESRFRKLKSFPATSKDQPISSFMSSKNQSSASKSEHDRDFDNGSRDKGVKTKVDVGREKNPDGKTGFDANTSSGHGLDSSNFELDGSSKDLDKEFDEASECLEEELDGTRGSKEKKKGGFSLSLSGSSNSSMDGTIFSTTKGKPNKKMQGKSTVKSGSFSYGCFLCSPKKKKNKGKKNHVKGRGLGYDWNMDDDDEFLSDLGVLSEKERDKILKKAMKEEEKVSREAEKIVKIAKQASARMNVNYGIKDEVSDDDDD